MALLDIDNLTVEFPSAGTPLRAVDGVSIRVEHGEVLGIVGESGSGKSVSMLAMMGLIPYPGRFRADRMAFDGHALPAGCNADIPKDALYIVTDIYPEHVVLDGNHPLAGIALRLHLQVHAVRAATEEETARGTAGTGFFRIQPQAPGGTGLH